MFQTIFIIISSLIIFLNCSSVYNDLEKEQSLIYKFDYWLLIEEFYYKPTFAPPFSLLIYIYFAIYYFARKLQKNSKNSVHPNISEKEKEEKSIENAIFRLNVTDLNINKRWYNLIIFNWTFKYNFHGLI
jgi:hypothetical protein